MSTRYEVHATNDITSVLIRTCYTIDGATMFAVQLLGDWEDIHIREYEEIGYKIVAKFSRKGLL